MTNKLALDEIDLRSETWRKLKEIMNARLDSHRKSNDLIGHDVNATAVLRGRIAELKHLIDLEAGPSQPIDANE